MYAVSSLTILVHVPIRVKRGPRLGAGSPMDAAVRVMRLRILIDTNRDPENFLKTNAFYDSKIVGKCTGGGEWGTIWAGASLKQLLHGFHFSRPSKHVAPLKGLSCVCPQGHSEPGSFVRQLDISGLMDARCPLNLRRDRIFCLSLAPGGENCWPHS